MRELGHFFVQMAMVERLEHFAVQDLLQLFQVDDETGLRIDLALHRDFQRVVVAVAVEVGALAERRAGSPPA